MQPFLFVLGEFVFAFLILCFRQFDNNIYTVLPIKSAPLPHFGQAAADFVRTSGKTGADAAHTILCLFRQYYKNSEFCVKSVCAFNLRLLPPL